MYGPCGYNSRRLLRRPSNQFLGLLVVGLAECLLSVHSVDDDGLFVGADARRCVITILTTYLKRKTVWVRRYGAGTDVCGLVVVAKQNYFVRQQQHSQ